jgi:hypothetical protein
MDDKKLPNQISAGKIEKKPFPKIVVSKEAREKQEKRRMRIDGVCKDFRAQKVSMSKPTLVENLLDFVYETAERKDDFAQFVIRKKYCIIL